MEINGIGGAKGSQGTGIPRGETAPTGQETSAALRRAVSDVLRISQEGREKIKSLLDPDWVRQQVESANQQADAEAKELKVLRQCQLIASRVMAGDRVPVEDLKYLAEHDMKLYSLAIAMKRKNPDPKDQERVSEDEEETRAEGVEGSEGGGSSAPVSEAAAPAAPAEGDGAASE